MAAQTSVLTILIPLSLLLIPFSLSAGTTEPAAQQPKYSTDAAVAAGPPVPILDIDGKAVRAGSSYYIIPATSSSASDFGGVRMATPTNDSTTATCPLSVVQDPHGDSSGTPLMFLPVATKTGYMVRTSTDLNIEFTADDTAICDEGNVWKVDDYDDDVERWFVGTGGVEGKPGPKTVNNWFKIVKYGGAGSLNYKVAYCPGVCKSCKIKCKDVGLFVDEDGNRRLALTEDHPFVVNFMRAD